MAFDSFYNGYLICALNWGLGHATRCIPIIQKLLDNGQRVVIASDGSALELLRHEFPQLASYELPSYDVTYSDKPNQLGHLITQIPKFAIARYKEHEAMDDIYLKERIGVIISDNRYGCWHFNCKNYIVSHQLKPVLTGWQKLMNIGLEILMLSLLNDFDEVWVPDNAAINLSGKLSSLRTEDKKFIGILSRFEYVVPKENYKNKLLIILSGPEPQRNILEKKVLEQCMRLKNKKCLIVQGITGEIKETQVHENCKMITWLDKEYLSDAINNSKYILCRSGYSSIMDLAVMGKKAILISTPGQSEQEYLAEKLMKEKKFFSISQEAFDLEKALNEVENYSGIYPTLKSSSLEIIDKIIASRR